MLGMASMERADGHCGQDLSIYISWSDHRFLMGKSIMALCYDSIRYLFELGPNP